MTIFHIILERDGVLAKLTCDADDLESLTEEDLAKILVEVYNETRDALDEHEVDKQLKKMFPLPGDKKDIPIQ